MTIESNPWNVPPFPATTVLNLHLRETPDSKEFILTIPCKTLISVHGPQAKLRKVDKLPFVPITVNMGNAGLYYGWCWIEGLDYDSTDSS